MEQSPSKTNQLTNVMIVGYISQLILFVLLIVYCILSPSLFSTIGIVFVMISVSANITRVYYVNDKQVISQKVMRIQQIELKAYPIQRVIWMIFSILNLVAISFKACVAIMDLQNAFSDRQLQFLEIQDATHMFLPILILPFSIGAIFISPRKKSLNKFRKQISEKTTTPMYYLLAGLTVLIQIWTQSFIGLYYFFCTMALFCVRQATLANSIYRAIVCTVQIGTLIIIPANFIVSTSYFQSFSFSQYYETIGIDGIINFNPSLKSRSHFITEITMFLYCCFLQRLFEYQKINKIANENAYNNSISESQIFGEQISARQSLQLSPRKMLHQSLLDTRKSKNELQNLNETRKSYELTQLYRQQKKMRSQTLPLAQILLKSFTVVNPRHEDVLKLHEQNKSRRSMSSLTHTQQSKKKQLQPKRLKVFWDNFLKLVNIIIRFLNSSDFSLRVAEVISIIIIQRYNNVYSFFVLVWLALVASIQNLKIVYLFTAIIILPMVVGNFVIMFIYNIPNSFFQDIQHKSIWGFQQMYLYWLDVIIFNVYLYYIIVFVFAASKQTRLSLYSKSKKILQPTNFVLICAFIFRYTYLFTITAMFFMGFSNVTVIELGYIILFFLFFTFGENLTLQNKTRKSKPNQEGQQKMQKNYILTTLSRKFWSVIVYYTLTVIVLKYIYFLFFQDEASQILDPIGINEQFNWAFNFSLTQVCKSNTTPFFIIFILAQSQIIVHRSNIYLNYSFSLIASTEQRNLQQDKQKQVTSKYQKLKMISRKILCFFLQFYYQGLYYFSGIIILACTYRWNIVQVPIVVLTCLGLLNRFDKKLLFSIVGTDLLFIFATYIFRFLNYRAVYNMFGQEVTQYLTKIAVFCGFNLNPNQSLYEIIALNVVIVYFSVESYRLCNKLNQKSLQSSVIPEESRQDKSRRKKLELPLTQYEPTIIDSEFNDKQFASHYLEGVIQATKTYYNTDMVLKYPWFRYICKLFTFIIVDTVSIIVLVCCLYFRLSVSMFAFLILYLIFYFFLFGIIGQYLSNVNYIGRMQFYLGEYNKEQFKLQNKQDPIKITHNHEKIDQLKQFIHKSFCEILDIKYSWKKKLWIYSAVLSVVCLVLTYAAQFIVSDFYVQQIHWEQTDRVQDVLFILGFSVNDKTSFFSQVYFYYLMIIINVIEKLLINFFQKDKQEAAARVDVKREFKQIIKAQNPQFLANEPQITRYFVVQQEHFQKLQYIDEDEQNSWQNLQVDNEAYEKQIVSTCNLLIYFRFKDTQIKINFIYALLSGMVRVYLWLMLINVYQKSNVSAFLYLFTVFYFWFRKIQFTVVKDISKAAITIFLIQYLMLLLDIQANTSPLPLPNERNLSLLQNYITDPAWLEFFVINKNQNKTSFIFISFLINSIIIFVTQLYFSGIQYVSKLCLKLTEQIWDRYQYIYKTILKTQTNQTLDLNYQSYKKWSYRVLQFLYQNFIVNSYIMVSILVLLLLSDDHTYISLGLLIIVFGYIYMGLFTHYGNQGKIYAYTIIFFKAFRIILFGLVLFSLILDIPSLSEFSNSIPDIVGLETTLEQVCIVLFVQLWLDSTNSLQFYRVTNLGLAKNHQKQLVRLQCLAYQSNNEFVKSMIKTFKEIMTFQLNIKEAKSIIKEWQNNFKVEQLQNKGEIQQSDILYQNEEKQNLGDVSAALKALRSQIRRQIRRKEKQDQQTTSTQKLCKYLQRNTNISLKSSYFQLMQQILRNNKKVLKKVLNKTKISIDIWDYILQDYSKLQQQIIKCRQQLMGIGSRVIQEDEQLRMDYLQLIIEQQYDTLDNIQQQGARHQGQNGVDVDLYKVITPKKINLILSQKDQQTPVAKKMWFFCLSNFNYFMVFMISIYYTINPCLLSLPIVVYIFSYYVIAPKKYNNVLLMYLFVVIVVAELFQLKFLKTSTWTKYFFYLPEGGSYNFSVGFLFFLFILIFIDQQIKKYQGVNRIHQSQAENFQTAALRILINQERDSSLYLWRMYFQDQQQYQKKNNPILYAADKISQNPQNLTKNVRPTFNHTFYRNRTGMDLYPYIATIQIFLTIYLIFFYPLMTLVNQSALSQSFKYFTFSSNMIIAIICHVFVIVVQRKITLLNSQNQQKELIKYIFTMIVFSLFLAFIYYWGSERLPSDYEPRPAMIAFSFFYFIYFFLSGLQVKYGYKKFKKVNSFMVNRNSPSYFFMLVFIAIPFLYEIKCIMDWTFLKTSLQLFDWFKLFSIYVSSFKAKMQQQGTLQTNLGSPVTWSGKIIGWIGFILLLLIIFGPMILFSGLNPTSQRNLVNGGSFQIGIRVIEGNQFTLYSTSHLSVPPVPITRQIFNELGFNDVPELQGLSNNDLSRQFQNISFQTYSDKYWGISPPNYEFLKTAFNQSTYQMDKSIPVKFKYQMTVQYLLNREIDETTASPTTFQVPSNGSLPLQIVRQLNDTFHNCSEQTTIPGLYNSLIRLATSGTTYKPTPIFYQDSNAQRYSVNLTLKMICADDGTAKNNDTNNIYWQVKIQNTQNGIQMYIFSDLYQSLLGGLSFTAIYTSVILVVAGFIRGLLAGNLPLIPYQMNAKPQKILQICQAIGIHRDRGQYKEEFLMYYQLIDVIRSPQVIRKLGSSYTTLIKQKDKVKRYKQMFKEEKQRKKNI